MADLGDDIIVAVSRRRPATHRCALRLRPSPFAMRLSALAIVAVAVAACAAGLVAAQQPPNYGSNLYIKGVMKLPYAGIVEPFESWYDGVRERVDYYDGMDSYIFRSDLNVTWQVNPMNNVKTCFLTEGEPDIRPYLPDLTGFQLQDDAVQIDNQMCDNWQLSVDTLGLTSTYNFYVSRTTQMPVRYQMMGYDSLIGSHFDLYVLDYLNVTTTAFWPASTFNQPNAQCGDFPGPGATHMNPLDEMEGYFPFDIPADQEVSPAYAAYLRAHGKSYGDKAELRRREMQYKQHSHWVVAHQRRFRVGKESYTVALNFMADHTPAELASRRGKLQVKGPRPSNGAGSYHARRYSDVDLPAAVDWRDKGAVNPPQDQGICGSCWSFGSTGAIEGAYAIKYGKLKVFAEQELMDCSWDFGNNACDGGEDYRAYGWIMQNGGMSFKENYGPYLMQDGYCQAASKKADASMSGYVNTTEFSEVSLMDALASVGPVSISIDASHPGLSFYTNGVYYDPACGSGLDDLDHSVLAVGYGTDAVGGDYWIVKNSWSTYWGDQGYIKMSRKNNNCGVASQPTYVVLN